MELSITATLALVGVAFFAGLVSSIAGSGGLLTLPALLWASPALRAGHQQVAKCHGYVEFGDQFQAPRLSPYRTAGTIADDGILRFDAGHAVRTALIE